MNKEDYVAIGKKVVVLSIREAAFQIESGDFYRALERKSAI